MLTINKSQLIEKILSHKFKYCIVYDALLRSIPENLPYFERWTAESPEEIVNRLQVFAKEYPHQFSFMCKTKTTGNGIKPFLYNVDLRAMESSTAGTGQVILNGSSETPEQMEERILAKIKGQLENQQLINERDQAKLELQNLQTNGNKLAYVFEQIFLKKYMPAQGQLQGTGEADIELSDEDAEAFQESITELTRIFGPKAVIILVDKLGRDPDTINLIKNYTNG